MNRTERPSRPPVQIRAVGRALPGHFVDQESLTAALREAWGAAHFNAERLEGLHRSVQVSGRYVALPLSVYRELTTFARRNEAWVPEIVRQNVRNDVDGFLAMSGHDRSSIRHWIAHTGGPKVLFGSERRVSSRRL